MPKLGNLLDRTNRSKIFLRTRKGLKKKFVDLSTCVLQPWLKRGIQNEYLEFEQTFFFEIPKFNTINDHESIRDFFLIQKGPIKIC
jgi:hypothetical protein